MFHFVTYVPINGRLYELDGLKEGPVDHGKVPEGTDWLDAVIPVLMERMAKYQAGIIHVLFYFDLTTELRKSWVLDFAYVILEQTA